MWHSTAAAAASGWSRQWRRSCFVFALLSVSTAITTSVSAGVCPPPTSGGTQVRLPRHGTAIANTTAWLLTAGSAQDALSAPVPIAAGDSWITLASLLQTKPDLKCELRTCTAAPVSELRVTPWVVPNTDAPDAAMNTAAPDASAPPPPSPPPVPIGVYKLEAAEGLAADLLLYSSCWAETPDANQSWTSASYRLRVKNAKPVCVDHVAVVDKTQRWIEVALPATDFENDPLTYRITARSSNGQIDSCNQWNESATPKTCLGWAPYRASTALSGGVLRYVLGNAEVYEPLRQIDLLPFVATDTLGSTCDPVGRLTIRFEGASTDEAPILLAPIFSPLWALAPSNAGDPPGPLTTAAAGIALVSGVLPGVGPSVQPPWRFVVKRDRPMGCVKLCALDTPSAIPSQSAAELLADPKQGENLPRPEAGLVSCETSAEDAVGQFILQPLRLPGRDAAMGAAAVAGVVVDATKCPTGDPVASVSFSVGFAVQSGAVAKTTVVYNRSVQVSVCPATPLRLTKDAVAQSTPFGAAASVEAWYRAPSTGCSWAAFGVAPEGQPQLVAPSSLPRRTGSTAGVVVTHLSATRFLSATTTCVVRFLTRPVGASTEPTPCDVIVVSAAADTDSTTTAAPLATEGAQPTRTVPIEAPPSTTTTTTAAATTATAAPATLSTETPGTTSTAAPTTTTSEAPATTTTVASTSSPTNKKPEGTPQPTPSPPLPSSSGTTAPGGYETPTRAVSLQTVFIVVALVVLVYFFRSQLLEMAGLRTAASAPEVAEQQAEQQQHDTDEPPGRAATAASTVAALGLPQSGYADSKPTGDESLPMKKSGSVGGRRPKPIPKGGRKARDSDDEPSQPRGNSSGSRSGLRGARRGGPGTEMTAISVTGLGLGGIDGQERRSLLATDGDEDDDHASQSAEAAVHFRQPDSPRASLGTTAQHQQPPRGTVSSPPRARPIPDGWDDDDDEEAWN